MCVAALFSWSDSGSSWEKHGSWIKTRLVMFLMDRWNRARRLPDLRAAAEELVLAEMKLEAATAAAAALSARRSSWRARAVATMASRAAEVRGEGGSMIVRSVSSRCEVVSTLVNVN